MRNPAARVSDPNSFVSDPGSPFHDILEPRFTGDHTTVVSVGRENIQERIQAQGPYTDINYMLTCLGHGDTSVLTTHRAFYGDVSDFPTNPVDAINLIRSAERRFALLTSDERSKYNNDWQVWLSAVLSDPSALNAPVEEPVEQPDSSSQEVTTDES